MTLIKLFEMWRDLKSRRERLHMTQPDMAQALGLSVSTYTHYEASAECLTYERLIQMDGQMAMLEMMAGVGDKGVDNPVDGLGKKSGKLAKVYKVRRLQDVIPASLTGSSTGNPQKKTSKNMML